MNNEDHFLEKALEKEKVEFEKFYLWLKRSLPDAFFKELPPDWISLIIHALIGFKVQDFFSEIHLKSAAITLSLDSPEADMRILKSYPMYGIKSYTTYVSKEPLPFPEKEQQLRIALIHFTKAVEAREEPLTLEEVKILRALLDKMHPDWDDKKIQELIHAQDPSFLRKMSTERKVIAIEMLERAQTRDQCQLTVEHEEKWKEKKCISTHIIIAWKNTPKHNFLYRLARLIYRHHLIMYDVTATYLNPYATNSILMLSFSLHGENNQATWEETDIEDFLQELVTLKYFGSLDLIEQTFIERRLLRGNLGNFLRAAVNFIHQVLLNVDTHEYSIEQIVEGLCHHPDLTIMVCHAFEHKFHPKKHNYLEFEKVRDAFTNLVLHLDTGHEGQDSSRRNILLQAMNFVIHILKCNFYCSNKTALAFRMDPYYLENAPFAREKIFPELPFAIFFIKGMHFIAFHIRFKDLARGGLRTVYTTKKDKMLAERNRVFLECYHLALTQHKKNKDIPEGGAKAIIFLKPYDRLESEAEILKKELKESRFTIEESERRVEQFKKEQQLEYLYQTQRNFIDSFLSIINCNNDGSLKMKNIIDYYHLPEYIYLGPDENMHDVMIEWIAAKSIQVGYRPGGAFISGKPSCGINHKKYGVTSCGVNVYMDEVLKYLGINPLKDTFSIKITGGPDGDVAGNQIYNLYHDYPKTAKLLALTDVSGTIYDPLGLDLEIMVGLFKRGHSIRYYPPEKLTPGGFLLDREMKREPTPYSQQTLCLRNKEGALFSDWLSGSEMNALYRNNVHQVKSDIFLPCGGRPRTLCDTNYTDLLDPEGKPTARAIIEGANLYISPWARLSLEKLGVLIVKDSSANKCGVICSSFEILAGLALEEREFLEYKDPLVKEIIERLKYLALSEAKLLLERHTMTHEPLSQISDEISDRIIFFTDQLLEYLKSVKLSEDPADPLVHSFLEYCPKVLREHFQKELLLKVPENHQKAIIAAHIASKLVYERGLEWFPSIVDILPLLL